MNKNILELIILIALDNNIPMKPTESILWPSDIDWERFDYDAEKLSIDEAETFCCGDKFNMNVIAQKYDLQELSDILNQIFDGDLYDYFYAA